MVQSIYSTVAVRNAAVDTSTADRHNSHPRSLPVEEKFEPPLLCTLDEWMVKAPAIVPIQSRFLVWRSTW